MNKKGKISIISLSIIIISALMYGLFSIVQWASYNDLNLKRGVPSTELWFEDDELDIGSIQVLQKKSSEDFTILLFSDIQLESHPVKDRETLDLVDSLVEEVKPDFIMTGGDNSSWTFAHRVTGKLIRQMESYAIPWGVTLGNHDSEGVADRVRHGNLYESAEYSLFRQGPSNIHGVGNYAVNIEDEKGSILYSLIMLDSNTYRMYKDGRDYDFIYYDQIKWYEWLVGEMAASEGRTVPSMLFFHIPLPEFAEAYNALERGEINDSSTFGEKRERVCSSPVNTGLFNSVLDLGSTTHIFCGHDHVNNFSIDWKGVRLTYGLKTGTTSYSDDDMRGATVITIKAHTNEVQVEHLFR